jgi:hypothetical protein
MQPDGSPGLIFITGADGSGKTHLANVLKASLAARGYRTEVVWSRFQNFISKPFLALTRLTGHNHYRVVDGVRFGFHDFQGLGRLRWLFAILQAVDVNIGAFRNITCKKRNVDVLICERGPWDTLSDVMVDTGLKISPQSLLGRVFLLQAKKACSVVLIRRSPANVIATRPELRHDYKLEAKVNSYNYLAIRQNWAVIDNNSSLSQTESALKQYPDIHRLLKRHPR